MDGDATRCTYNNAKGQFETWRQDWTNLREEDSTSVVDNDAFEFEQRRSSEDLAAVFLCWRFWSYLYSIKEEERNKKSNIIGVRQDCGPE